LPGERAGLIALQSHFGTIGIRAEKDGFYVSMTVSDEKGGEKELESFLWQKEEIYLKIFFDFEDSRDIADFYCSEDGVNWKKVGKPLQMLYTLDHFMGYRIGLFAYTTEENSSNGYGDFAYFRYAKGEEAR